MFALNRLLQNNLTGFKVAARRGLRQCGHGLVADVVLAQLKHLASMIATALGALAQRCLRAEVLYLAGLGIFVVAKVKFKLEVFGFFVKLDDHLCRERPARFGAEAFQWADLFVAQKLLDLGIFKRAARRRFAE